MLLGSESAALFPEVGVGVKKQVIRLYESAYWSQIKEFYFIQLPVVLWILNGSLICLFEKKYILNEI